MPLQRLFETALATASSTGAAQFNFPSPPTMLVWEGTIGIVGPPSGAQFFALVGGSQWCSWNGNNVGGPVQALPGEEVIVTATGLAAGVQYTAQWIGFSVSRDEATLKYPATSSAGGVVSQPPGTSLTVTESGGALQATATRVAAGTAVVLAAPAAGTNYLLKNVNFTLGSGATQVQLIGHTSGFVYAQAFSSSEAFEAMEGQIAGEALDFVATGGGGSLWLSYDNGTTAGSASPGGSSGGGSTVAGGNAWYSDGKDGTVTFDGSSVVLGLTPSSNVYTLARDIRPSLMTVNTGVTINCNGWRVYVHGSLINNGHIQRDGNAGTNGSGAGTFPGGAGLNNATASLEGSTTTGKPGGSGFSNSGGQNGTGDGTHPFYGGSGGNGGHGGGPNNGGTGGSGGSDGNPADPITTSTGKELMTSLNNYECGAGGGGGGGDATHGGGGGGGGGGHVVLAAQTITGTGSITANGGNGGNGDPAGVTGGGGGGGGGIVHLISGSVSGGAVPGQTITANGGTGGTQGTSGTAGGNGGAGIVVMLAN